MIEVLTGLRALALCAIYIHHIEYFSGLAAMAVSFFFVLSGFVLAYTYSQKFAQLSWQNFRQFMIVRLARIYPLHWVTFLASVPVVIALQMKYNLIDAVMNIFLLQSYWPIGDKVFSFNSVSWAISDEVFFYLCFPVVIFVLHKLKIIQSQKRLLSLMLGLVVIAFGIGLQMHKHMQTYSLGMWIIYFSPYFRLIDFLVGVLTGLLFLIVKQKVQESVKESPTTRASVLQPSRTLGFTCLELFTVLALLAAYYSPFYKYDSLVYGVYFLPFIAVLIFVFAFQKGAISWILSHKVLLHLGKISYPFYLVHQILIRAVYIYWTPIIFGHLQNAQQLELQLGVFVLSVVVSEGLYRLVEVPVYQRARRWQKAKAELKQAVYARHKHALKQKKNSKSLRITRVFPHLSFVS